MTAALRRLLVFKVAAGEAGFLQQGDGAGGVERGAEAGVDIDEDGQRAGPCDRLRAGDDLALGHQPDVGQAEISGERRARYVDAVETLALDELRHDRRERTGEAQQGAACERCAERPAAFRRRRRRDHGRPPCFHAGVRWRCIWWYMMRRSAPGRAGRGLPRAAPRGRGGDR